MVTTRSKTTQSGKNEKLSGDRLSKKHDREGEPPKSAKKAKQHSSKALESGAAPKSTAKVPRGDRIGEILKAHGERSPVFSALKDPQQSTPETVLAHLLNALISSARMSHSIATNTLEQTLSAGYHNLETLEKSSWEERTELLTKGGYTRYREKTATAMGDMANHLREKYDGDASRVVEVEESDAAKTTVAKRAKEFKGIGQLGAEIFLETIQAAAPYIAPTLSNRNLETVEKMDLGDPDSIFEELHRNALSMAKLSQALTLVRLEGKVDEYT